MPIRLTALAALLAIVTPSSAHDFKVGSTEIGHPWSRPTPPNARVAGGYVTLTNNGLEADSLIGVESPDAESAEIHHSVVENGVASMRPVETIEIAPGASVDFEAERLHFMFIEPDRPLRDGDRFPATLVFEKAGSIDVEFMVQMRASGNGTRGRSLCADLASGRGL